VYSELVEARCGCRFTVDDHAICHEVELGVWNVVYVFWHLERPETPTVVGREWIEDHADCCLLVEQ